MNILILNWRDIKNPEGGGAEVLTHEMVKRWVKSGHDVTQFSALFPRAPAREKKDGVIIIRQGSADIRSTRLPVHVAAYFWYLQQKKGRFDVVIDEIHGIPFFTPWYVPVKKVAFICEVATGIWDATFSFPLNRIGRTIERYYFRFYKNTPFLTISPSTKKDLLQIGIQEQNITVLPMGLNVPKKTQIFPKEKNPTLIFVGRLTKAKGIEDALGVVAKLKRIYPKIHLWIVGQGNSKYTEELVNIANRLEIRDHIKFFGFVSQDKKFELMRRAYVLLAPSMKEGWGLTVPEAGYVGTPSIGYDVQGLRDVIVHNKTGLLTGPTAEKMSLGISQLLQDQSKYKEFQKEAERLALTYSWDKTAHVALSVLKQT